MEEITMTPLDKTLTRLLLKKVYAQLDKAGVTDHNARALNRINALLYLIRACPISEAYAEWIRQKRNEMKETEYWKWAYYSAPMDYLDPSEKAVKSFLKEWRDIEDMPLGGLDVSVSII